MHPTDSPNFDSCITTKKARTVFESLIQRRRMIFILMAVLFCVSANVEAAKVYKVQWGDTLCSLSRRFGVAVRRIIVANNLRNPNLILVGQKLVIPGKNPAKKIVQDVSVKSVQVSLKPPSEEKNFLQRMADTAREVIASLGSDSPYFPGAMSFQPMESAAPARQSLSLLVGESRILRVQGMTRTAVGDPQVADVVAISPKELLVNGKAQGRTSLFVWDRAGLTSYNVIIIKDTSILRAQIDSEIGSDTIRVQVVNDTAILEGVAANQLEADRAEAIAKAHAKNVTNLIQVGGNSSVERAEKKADELSKLIGQDCIHVKVINDSIFLEGKASKKDASRALKVATAFANTGSSANGKVVDLIQPANPLQIQVKAKVVEISKTALKDFGVTWGSLARSGEGPDATVKGQSSIFSSEQFIFGQINRGGGFEELDLIGGQLRAMVKNNQAKILSEPTVLVADGNKANILVGGEIPIPVSQQSSGGGISVTVDYKEFGIKLDIEPTITEDNTILLHVKPEVSTLDYENAVVFSGFVIPAIRTRRADSIVTIGDKQTMVIGGLVSSNIAKQVKKIPLLGDIPVLGELFKSNNFTRDESDLVIFISPEIVRPGEKKQ